MTNRLKPRRLKKPLPIYLILFSKGIEVYPSSYPWPVIGSETLCTALRNHCAIVY